MAWLKFTFASAVISFLLCIAVFASTPALSGSVQNGVLSVTVTGVSSRTYPQVIVLSKNKDDPSDFYLDTINLKSGQKSISHAGVSGKSYTLTGILKNKDGTDAAVNIYGTAALSSASSSSNSRSSSVSSDSRAKSRNSGVTSSVSADSAQNEKNTVSDKPSASSINTVSGGVTVQSYPVPVSDAGDYTSNGSITPLIIMSAILIVTSAIFARNFSKKK